MPRTIHLHNDHYTLDIDPRTGGIQRFADTISGDELIAEPRLAEGFRLLLPIPGKNGDPSTGVRCNYIMGNQQRPPRIASRGANHVALHWAGPLRSEFGSFKLGVTLRIALATQEVRFRCEVHNGTRYELAEVWFAFLGGMMGLGKAAQRLDTEVLVPLSSNSFHKPIFRDFGNTRGQTLGVLSVEHGFAYPGHMSMPWISFFHKKLDRAVYFAALEEAPRVKVVRFGLEPGAAERRLAGNWPRADEVGKLPRGLVVNWTHFPHTKPGDTFVSSPVVLRCHAGGWRNSAALYAQWFGEHHPIADCRANYMRRETAFVHTMFMLPEDNINLRFKDIPRWAKGCRDHGVHHVMIAGWNVGGHDRGYPYYVPDPRLGTWKELEAGIRRCHDLGMKVSFFINCQPVDASTTWFQRELKRYQIMQPSGHPPHIISYWGMGTLGARSRFTATPFVEINPHHPRVRKLLIDQFRRLVEIGADGLHLDKLFNHPMDFNPRLRNTSPDRAHHEGLLKFAQEFTDMARAINPDFAWSYEGNWDRFLSYTDALWWGPADSPLKAAFPEMGFTTGVEQPYDYNKMNYAVLEGDALIVGPGNYNRGLDWPPFGALAKYIGNVTRIRRKFWDTLCAGEVVDASHGLFASRQPAVRFGGPMAKSPDIRWRLIRNRRTGQRAITLVNLGATPLRATELRLVNESVSPCRIYHPGHAPKVGRLPMSITIPAERVAFVIL